MTLRITVPGPTGLATTVDARLDFAGLVVHHADGTPRAGLFPTHDGAIGASRSDMGVDIRRFAGALVRDGGVLLVANDGTATVELPAAPGAGLSRIDVVYAKQNEADYPGSTDPDNDAIFGVASGTATGGVPSMPDLSAIEGALPLVAVRVPSGVTATNASGVTITDVYPYTASPSGVVLVRNADELDAYDALDGLLANRLDSSDLWRRVNGAWVNSDIPEHGSAKRLTAQTIPNNVWTPISFTEAGPLQGFTYSSSGLIVEEAGTYLLEIRLVFKPNGAGYRAYQVKQNGAPVEPSPFSETKLANGAVHSTNFNQAQFVDLDEGDALTLEAWQSSGGNLQTNYSVEMRIIRITDRRLFTVEA